MTVIVIVYFHPIFTLFSPDHFPGQHKNDESTPNYLSLRAFRAGRTYILSAPFIAAESPHHEESRLIYGPFEFTLIDQEFPVEHELDTFNPLLTGTPLCRLYLLLRLQRCVIQLRYPATSFLGNILWRLSSLSPTATRSIHLWVTTSSLSLNTTFAISVATHNSAQAFSIALTVATHILLRYLASIIPSQLINYFLPSFPRDLQHKNTLYSSCH